MLCSDFILMLYIPCFRVKIIHVREDVVLEINGKKIRLKDFPMRALKGTVVGFIKSLNLEEDPKEIKITIVLNDENSGDSRVQGSTG